MTNSEDSPKAFLAAVGIAIAIGAVVVLIVAMTIGTAGDERTADPQRIVPASVAPAVEPMLALAFEAPHPLSDTQRMYIERAGIIPSCPLCFGVDRPALTLDGNGIALWQALFCTEVSCQPWDEYGNAKVSSAGCVGASQICNMTICGGVTERDRRNPEMSLYLGACYLQELIERYDGDYRMAVAAYKGALIDGVITHPEQVDSVWSYIRVRGVTVTRP
jgi:hypothetical protein